MKFFANILSTTVTLIVLHAAGSAVAGICKSGQMGIGVFSTGTRAHGELLANNCGVIASSDDVAGTGFQDPSQPPCIGGYERGASVTCDSNGFPTSAVDTKGNHWKCGKNTGGRCSIAVNVLACCDRA